MLACYRYIELNPVRAAMVATPADYRWSSHGHNAQGRDDPRITPHPVYLALAREPATREAIYRSLFDSAPPSGEAESLRLHTRQQKPWGSEKFRQQIEALANRSMEVRPRGRPRSERGK